MDEWSVHPAPDGRHVYFTAGGAGWRVETESGQVEQMVDLAACLPRGAGRPAAQTGPTTLSRCGRWWAMAARAGDRSYLVVVETASGQAQCILERDVIAHPQFCPDDPDLLFYAGPLHDRVWVIGRDGTGNRRLYQRQPGEWITHETWIPGTREVAFVDWPRGVRAVQVETGAHRWVTTLPAWHPAPHPQGGWMVADTNFPDVGLQLFPSRDGLGAPRVLCHPEASSLGEHWDGPFPYERGPVAVYAPQHTHPHPSFSPDGRWVAYTSDRSGFSQVYEVEVAW